MKLFRTSNIDIVCAYQSQFSFDLPTIIDKRVKTLKESLVVSRLYIPRSVTAALSHLNLSIASFKCTTHLEGIHVHILHQ